MSHVRLSLQADLGQEPAVGEQVVEDLQLVRHREWTRHLVKGRVR